MWRLLEMWDVLLEMCAVGDVGCAGDDVLEDVLLEMWDVCWRCVGDEDVLLEMWDVLLEMCCWRCGMCCWRCWR